MNNDLISRSALLKALKEQHDYIMQDPEVSKTMKWCETVCFNRTVEAVDSAPAVDAGPKWISVKDRLPEDEVIIDGDVYYRDVVVAFRDPNCPAKVAYYDKELEAWLQPLDFMPLENVTHWMPLPEQPKEG